jgi:hypothetical protein
LEISNPIDLAVAMMGSRIGIFLIIKLLKVRKKTIEDVGAVD